MASSRVEQFDARALEVIRRAAYPVSRFALFLVYFWFGALKLFDASPANPLVANLLERTLPFVTFENFIVGLGIFEMLIGIAFAIPHLERLAILLLIPHMIMTTGPLVLLPAIAWSAPLIPTLEGQYIIKNILIIALALGLAAHLQPLHMHHAHGVTSPPPAPR